MSFVKDFGHWFLILNHQQGFLGRVLLILKEHKTDEMELTNEEVMAKAMEYARSIAIRATFAIGRIKSCINQGFDLTFKESMELECNSQGEVFKTQDCREGTQAFLEKRSPKFVGK